MQIHLFGHDFREVNLFVFVQTAQRSKVIKELSSLRLHSSKHMTGHSRLLEVQWPSVSSDGRSFEPFILKLAV